MPVLLRRSLVAGLAVILLAAAVTFGWWLCDQRQQPATDIDGLTATEVVRFEPWVGNQLGKASIETGGCFGPSIASGRSDAYRCSVGNRINDPCFADPEADKVACPSVDLQDLTIIELSDPLSMSFDPRKGDEWYLVLEDGQTCGAITGTGPPDHESGIGPSSFGCTLGWGYGGINKIEAVWTIKLAADEKGALITERVRTAYR